MKREDRRPKRSTDMRAGRLVSVIPQSSPLAEETEPFVTIEAFHPVFRPCMLKNQTVELVEVAETAEMSKLSTIKRHLLKAQPRFQENFAPNKRPSRSLHTVYSV